METNEIILYQPNETMKLEVRLKNETIWLNRNQIAELFGRDVKTIGKHVANALKEELAGIPVVAKFAITATDGKISTQLRQDVARHNAQYPGVTLHVCDKAHDRFLIIDEEVYHIGHSLNSIFEVLSRSLFIRINIVFMVISFLVLANDLLNVLFKFRNMSYNQSP